MLMEAASYYGSLSILLVLLQHSADPDLQNSHGFNALMMAAEAGHEACVQALLHAKANTELLAHEGGVQNFGGLSALHWAEMKGHTAIAKLLQRHASCLSLGLGPALCAALPPTWSWVALTVVLGAIGTVAIRRALTARPGQHRAARQRRPRRTARHAASPKAPTAASPAPGAPATIAPSASEFRADAKTWSRGLPTPTAHV